MKFCVGDLLQGTGPAFMWVLSSESPLEKLPFPCWKVINWWYLHGWGWEFISTSLLQCWDAIGLYLCMLLQPQWVHIHASFILSKGLISLVSSLPSGTHTLSFCLIFCSFLSLEWRNLIKISHRGQRVHIFFTPYTLSRCGFLC